jgi:hypothetical protein
MVEARSIRGRLVVPTVLLTVLGLLGPGLAPHGGGSRSRTLAPARPGSNLQPRAARTLIADPSIPLAPQVSTSLQNDTSPALRTLRPVAPLSSASGVRPGAPVESNELDARGEPTLPGRDATAASAVADPVLQTSAPTSMPSPVDSFRGLTNAENGSATGFLFAPSDVNGDAGAGKYVQIVNGTFAVYDSDGSRLYGPAGINTVWSGFGGICETHLDGDPVAVFDEQAGRWLISEFALQDPSNYDECIAISKTADPTGAWYRYDFNYPKANVFGDYPKFGVWSDGYYMSANQFTSNLTWAGGGAIVYERDKMLVGQPARQIYFDLSSRGLAAMLPSDIDGATAPPAGAPDVFAQIDDTSWGYSKDELELWGFHTDWTTPAQSSFTQVAALQTAPFDSNICGSPPCIGQPGTSQKLDDMSDRLMYRLQYRNLGAQQTLVVSHTVSAGGGRAGVRWYELSDAGSGWQIADQGTFAPSDGNSRWMGSAAMDVNGDIAVGYSVSGSGTFPSVRYAGRLASDPAGTLGQGEATAFDGTGSQTGTERWGDYSSMSVDPRDGCTFWYTQMAYSTTSSMNWRTQIATFRFPGCSTGSGPGPASVTGPTLSDPFQADPSFSLAWDAGAPDLTYDVRYRRATATSDFGAAVQWMTATSASGATFTGRPGSTYCFSARATDASFFTGPWGHEACTAIPLNETDLATSGKWAEKHADGTYLGDYLLSTKRGATLTKTKVQAKSIALIATTCPTCGTVKVVWKGAVIAKLALTSAVSVKDVLLPVVGFNAAKTGDLRIVVASAGKPVKIEGVALSHV